MQQHIKYEVMDLDELEPFDGNARQHDGKTLETSIKVHGQYRTLLVRETDDGRHVLIAGHGTAEAMKARGHTKARVEVLSCTDEEALQINLMDNKSNDLAGYFENLLAAQLELVKDGGMWEGTGWDEKTAAKYLDAQDGDEGDEQAAETWAIIVNCRDEAQQADLLDKFTAEGLDCKALVT